jgi:hypothetical protein
VAIAGLAVLMFGGYNGHYVGGAISEGSMPKLGGGNGWGYIGIRRHRDLALG